MRTCRQAFPVTRVPLLIAPGLRYPVEMILELLSSGMTIDEILADYEDLEREDILAGLGFAARLSQIKRLEPVSP